MSAEKINLPIRRFIEQKIRDNFKDIDFRRGTAFNDLYAKVAAVLQQPYRHELNILKINQSIVNFEFMSDEDIELLIGNLFVTRATGTRSTGVVRIFFNAPGDYSFRTLFFSTPGGLRFRNINPIQVTVETLLPNRQEDGSYALDVVCEAEFPGSRYSVNAGDINLVENQPSVIFRVENPDDFAEADDTETNAMLYDKARRSISVRNLINDSSIQTVLRNQFGFIRDVKVVGAGDPAMFRDMVTIPGSTPISIHVGGKTDIYLDTTGIRSYSLNISNIPENLSIACVTGPDRVVTYESNSGEIDGSYLLDPFNDYIVDGVNAVIRGNKVEVIRFEFGQQVVDEYEVSDVIGTNRIRISSGLSLDTLDAVIPAVGNRIQDFISGDLSQFASHGDYLSIGNGPGSMIEYVDSNQIFVYPQEFIKVVSTFPIDINYDQSNRTASVSSSGIGGDTGTTGEVTFNDVLYIQTGSAGGRWEVINRVSQNEVWVARDVSEIDVDFSSGGPNEGSTSDPISEGDYVINQSNGDAYQVISISPLTFDRIHGISSSMTVWRASSIIEGDISAGDRYSVSRAAERISIADFDVPISIPSISDDLDDGDHFIEYASGESVISGDLVVNNDGDRHRVVGVTDNGTNLYAQITPPWSGGTISSGSAPVIERFQENAISQPSQILSRSIANSEVSSEVSISDTTVPGVGIGIGARPGDMLFIHDGPGLGFYDIASSWDRNPNAIELEDPVLTAIPEGSQTSVLRGSSFGIIAMGDVVYLPSSSLGDFSSISSVFPSQSGGELIHITSGPNTGSYEIIEYISENMARIAGDLISHGQVIVPSGTQFTVVTQEGSTTIEEPPMIDVDPGDTFVLNDGGEEFYHYVSARSGNEITISPPLNVTTSPGSQRYRVIRSYVNPAVVLSRQVRARVDRAPNIVDRRIEGSDGHAVEDTHVFSSSVDFQAIFGSIAPAGYELRILSGTHARPQPYIISGFSGSQGLEIDQSLTESSDEYDSSSGFVGTTAPPETEVYEIVKRTQVSSNVSYRIVEEHSYYEDEFFTLPMLAIRDIFTFDDISGTISDSPLVFGSDYVVDVIDVGLRYSPSERIRIRFLDENLRFARCRIRYYSDPTISLVDSFVNGRENRITNNDSICKRMESTFIDVSLSLRGEISEDEAETIINRYITTRSSSQAIEASDIISELYESGATYVNTETLQMSMTYYTSTGNVILESSRTVVGSGDTATYIPGSINVNLMPGI